MLPFVLLAILLLLALWLLASRYNYKRALRHIEAYKKEEDRLLASEKKYQETNWRAQFFVRRMEMREEYSELSRMADGLRENPEAFKKQLQREHLKTGFLLNLLR